ncbi:cyclic nucleotide-binding domain-containing protein 2-like [Platysternon megacephalum]|uniref:Cyclic nucleotide-binding domain-containing protein 2-like n=1 Tax=Platysternon megacephalum TaxID=55544 RepID=A0A4D9DZR7_9SAUR|nr:cyclic nucleotide-binding domain-containing protein 2-like [Platysternon megacephalum]
MWLQSAWDYPAESTHAQVIHAHKQRGDWQGRKDTLSHRTKSPKTTMPLNHSLQHLLLGEAGTGTARSSHSQCSYTIPHGVSCWERLGPVPLGAPLTASAPAGRARSRRTVSCPYTIPNGVSCFC